MVPVSAKPPRPKGRSFGASRTVLTIPRRSDSWSLAVLQNAVTRANPSDAGPQLLHVRQNVRQAEASLPESPGLSTARSFDFARCRSQECSHTDLGEGTTPAVRPGRSGPFRIETTTLDEARKVGGIQIPLNPRPVGELVIPLTQRLLGVRPILVAELGQSFPGGESINRQACELRKSATNAPGALTFMRLPKRRRCHAL
jgi:hypothetical protein